MLGIQQMLKTKSLNTNDNFKPGRAQTSMMLHMNFTVFDPLLVD
jgi:hypothetical protein